MPLDNNIYISICQINFSGLFDLCRTGEELRSIPRAHRRSSPRCVIGVCKSTGADASTRMKLTGHSSVDMNLVYTHATAALQKAIDALPTICIA